MPSVFRFWNPTKAKADRVWFLETWECCQVLKHDSKLVALSNCGNCKVIWSYWDLSKLIELWCDQHRKKAQFHVPHCRRLKFCWNVLSCQQALKTEHRGLCWSSFWATGFHLNKYVMSKNKSTCGYNARYHNEMVILKLHKSCKTKRYVFHILKEGFSLITMISWSLTSKFPCNDIWNAVVYQKTRHDILAQSNSSTNKTKIQD